MTGNNKYDALGELFRQRLEAHRIPIDGNGWDEIERRICKRKNKAVIWRWFSGTVAAAASVAALLIFSRPATDDTAVVTVSQQIPVEETDSKIQKFNDSKIQRFKDSKIVLDKPAISVQSFDNSVISSFSDSITQLLSDSDTQLLSDSDAQSFDDSVTQLFHDSVIPKLDISPVEDRFEEDYDDTKKTGKWLLVAAFGAGGHAGDSFNNMFNSSDQSSQTKSGIAGSNAYATSMSHNIRSLDGMSKDDFTNIRHRPPLSFGVTARKNLRKRGGVESGLVYTYLASRFEWSGYDVHQSLHYVGIPVNITVYLWDFKSNWRVYLSGGVTAEKGIRAVYRQEKQSVSEYRTTTVKSSSIDGWQWSLNGALGVNYRLENGWGICFEPRVGYSFDCNQPVSVRTVCPLYFGIHLGLNYQLK